MNQVLYREEGLIFRHFPAFEAALSMVGDDAGSNPIPSHSKLSDYFGRCV